MKTKSLCALALGIVVLLSGCSASNTLSGADKAKEEQIAALRAHGLEVTELRVDRLAALLALQG